MPIQALNSEQRTAVSEHVDLYRRAKLSGAIEGDELDTSKRKLVALGVAEPTIELTCRAAWEPLENAWQQASWGAAYKDLLWRLIAAAGNYIKRRHDETSQRLLMVEFSEITKADSGKPCGDAARCVLDGVVRDKSKTRRAEP